MHPLKLRRYLPSQAAQRSSILLAALGVAPVHAAEVDFEGSYRARFRAFDTLSLDRTLSNSEGLALYGQHRLWLRPRVLVSDQVSLLVDFKGLDNVTLGDQPLGSDNPVPNAPPVFEHDLTAPTSATDDAIGLDDFTLWRAWADVHTGIGRFQFGRMPVMWGSGIWLNDGTSVRPHHADYGDTVDRVAWEYLVQNQFFVGAGFDANTEGFINQTDDTASFHAKLAFRNEQVTAGILTQVEHTPSRSFDLFSIDLAASAELGKLTVSGEGIGQFGQGDLENGQNDVAITAFGAVLDASLDLSPWKLGVEAGLASGDKTPNDQAYKTFTFDRDYSVGMILFEQPMPTLAAPAPTDENGGRSFDSAQSGNALSNALYLRPRLGRSLVDGLDAEVTWLAARLAKPTDLQGDRRSYGMEFGAGLRYTGIDHFDVGTSFAAFLPGSYYSLFTDEDAGYTIENFDEPVFGFELSGRVHF